MHIVDDIASMRKRPGMYLGSTTSRGVAHMLQEVTELVLHSLDGWPDTLTLHALDDGSFRLEWNGDSRYVAQRLVEAGIMALPEELALRHPFRSLAPHVLSQPWDLRGLRVLAGLFTTIVDLRDPNIAVTLQHEATFPIPASKGNGEYRKSSLTLLPDPDIFSGKSVCKYMQEHFRRLSFCFPTASFDILDHTLPDAETISFHHALGMKDCLEDTAREKGIALGSIFHTVQRSGVEGLPPLVVDVAVAWSDNGESFTQDYVNALPLKENLPSSAVVAGVVEACQNAKRGTGWLSREDTQAIKKQSQKGLCVAVSLHMANPAFSGSTRERFCSPEAAGAVAMVIGSLFPGWYKDQRRR